MKPLNSLAILFARIRPAIEPHIAALPHPSPAVVLFFSVSDGKTRAHTVTVAGASFDEAWSKGLKSTRAAAQSVKLAAKWLRVDWVESVRATEWGKLRGQLVDVKRNYFRYGLSLDEQFEHAFLETEINANAMLYGGNQIVHAVVNENNFNRYARIRHGLKTVDFDPARPVHVFSAAGAFVALDEPQVSLLAGAGRNAGRRIVEKLDADDTYRLIDASSRYLATQVRKSGRFHYGWHPCFDREIAAYNSLRHASSLYAMIEAWEVTQDPSLKQAIDRGLAYLTGTLIQPVKEGRMRGAAFLTDGNETKLGGNAVCLLALVKYSELTGTRKYLPLLEALATGILHMQDEKTGRFTHVLNYPELTLKEEFRIIYYDGEAAFGLMRLYGLTRDERWLQAVERAFVHFIEAEHWKASDHWLSYCVNELTQYRPSEAYYRFGIRNFASHLDFVLERITTFPTLLELMMAAQKMIERLQGQPDYRHLLAEVDLEKFYRALHTRAHYLLNGHFWPELAMFYANPARITGSFFIRHHAFRVRIDDVEHYLSGFVAYRKYLAASPSAIDEKEVALIDDPAPNGPVVTWGGDVNLGRRQHYRTQELGADKVLDVPAMKSADLRIANLECVISTLGEQGVRKGETSPYYYRARPEMISVLTASGIDVVATANNHSGDYGAEAILSQKEWLDAVGIGHCGSGENISAALSPVIRRAGNLNVAIFSIDATQPRFSASADRPGAAFIHLGRLEKWHNLLQPRISKARAEAHIVLVAVHWGDNLETVPDAREIAVGHALIDAGADAVLGASAHVLQGVEIYKGRPIIHDAGDFLFDAVRSESDDSGLFSLELSAIGVERVRFTPLYKGFGHTSQRTGEDAIAATKRFARLCREMGTEIAVTKSGAGIISLHPPVREIRDITPVDPVSYRVPPERDLAETLENRWVVDQVPDDCRIDPIRIGPLTLVGMKINPAETTRRCMLWVETFWSAEEPVAQDWRLDIRAVAPASVQMRPWGESMDHDPCDWMLPTSHWKPGRIYRDYYGLRPPKIERWQETVLDIVVGLASREGRAKSWTRLPQTVHLALPDPSVASEGPAPYRTSFEDLSPDRDPSQTWNADQLEYVTGGKWLVPPPEGWSVRSVVRHKGHIDAAEGPILFVASDADFQGHHEQFTDLRDFWDSHRRLPKTAHRFAGAVVAKPVADLPPDFPVLQVADPVKSVMELGLAARQRYERDVIAITGTAGKSTTLGMLKHVLSDKSMIGDLKPALASFDNYNTRVGAPSLLAGLARDHSAAIVEVAQSALWMKRGPVTRLVRPTIAVVTEIGISQGDKRVKSVEDTVKWKSRVFDGLCGQATAVIGEHLVHFDKVKTAAAAHAKRIVTFGASEQATLRILERIGDANGSHIRFVIPDAKTIALDVPLPGIGMSNNAMAVMGVLYAMGHDLEAGADALRSYMSEEGRLQRMQLSLADRGVADIIDDSWNATVSSMLNAISVFADVPRQRNGRKIAVLGRIVHLGELSQRLHESLAGPLMEASPDLVVTHGEEMRHLRAVLPERILGPHFSDAGALAAFLQENLRNGDLVLVKGSRRDSDFGDTVRLLRDSVAGRSRKSA